MARPKSFNPELGWLKDQINKFKIDQVDARARALAAVEERMRAEANELKRLVCVELARGAGPSEVANSTGLSRSTVIRWRDDYLNLLGYDNVTEMLGEVASEATNVLAGLSLGTVKRHSDGATVATVTRGGGGFNEEFAVDVGEFRGAPITFAHHLWYDTKSRVLPEYVGSKMPVMLADRPEWLTEEVINAAVAAVNEEKSA